MEERHALFFGVMLAIALMAGYIVLTVCNRADAAERLGELLSLVVVAVVSYAFGYSKRRAREQYGHAKPEYVSRLAYILMGLGIGLILQHAVLFGIDLTPTELLLGHEWIGLYAVVVSMVMLGMVKRVGCQG